MTKFEKSMIAGMAVCALFIYSVMSSAGLIP